MFQFLINGIIYGKINIRVPLLQIYVCEVWDCSKINVGNIKKAIYNFNGKAFENLSIDEKVALLNQTLLNIFRSYIPNKKVCVTIDNLHG